MSDIEQKIKAEDKRNNTLTDAEWNAKNKDFIQIYDNAMDRVIQLVEIDPLACKVFLFMCKIADEANNVVFQKEVVNETSAVELDNDKPQTCPDEVKKTPTNICPKCGGKLILKTAAKGANKGNQFWGCANFPKCRYIKNVQQPQ